MTMPHLALLLTLALAGVPAMAESTIPSISSISLDEERAKGNLHNDLPGSLSICGPTGCKVVGQFDENNLIHWNDAVTLDDLKGAMQGQADWTQWQVNQYRKANPIK